MCLLDVDGAFSSSRSVGTKLCYVLCLRLSRVWRPALRCPQHLNRSKLVTFCTRGQERTYTKISKDSGDSKGKCASTCVDPNALSDGIMTIDDGCTKVVSLITMVSCEEGVKATSTVYSGCLKGKAAFESLSVLAVKCSGESSGAEALSVKDIHGEDV